MKINRFFAWTAAAVLAFALTAVPMTDKPCCGASAVITAEAAEAEKLAFTVQPKIFRGKIGDTVVFSGLSAPAEDTVLHYADILSKYVEKVTIRNK